MTNRSGRNRDLRIDVSSSGVPQLVLASQSPRRRALLAALGVNFTVDAADVDEMPLPGEPPDALACRLCRAKAAAVAARHPGATVLAADTIVALDDMLLGKPADALDAAAMLRLLRGRTHQVYTAVCVANDSSQASQLSISDVTMRPYSDAEIAAYVATGDPLDKAGSYAIQHLAFSPVAAWAGCYASIMGLPLSMVAEMLADAGIVALANVPEICANLRGVSCCMRSS